MLATGDRLDRDALRSNLEQAGYHCVSQVMEHGEFAVRGSLIDLFPMGSDVPFRVDLLDDEIESIRSFDPESQRSLDTVERYACSRRTSSPWTRRPSRPSASATAPALRAIPRGVSSTGM
jgi:transcription-repair coupling factor (superfamily II helicase)